MGSQIRKKEIRLKKGNLKKRGPSKANYRPEAAKGMVHALICSKLYAEFCFAS